MKIIKRSGAEVPFDRSKITVAISKANVQVPETERLTQAQIDSVADDIEIECAKDGHALDVETIQDRVENGIMRCGAYNVAKTYITYRYRHALMRKANTTDAQILSLLDENNEEVKQENSNKNPTVVSVQRDYMAGEVSKDITRRFLLDEDIAKATPIISPSTCTTATSSISKICCKTERSSAIRKSTGRIRFRPRAISPRRLSRKLQAASTADRAFRSHTSRHSST